jgi:hypothetical protein
MRLFRTILVILVSLSVAVLPAAVGFGASASQATTSVSVAMPDCDHHMHMPSGKTEQSDSDCISIVGCVFHCFSVTGATATAVAFAPVVAATLQPLRADDRLSPQIGSLPFRPPRV